MKKGFSDAFIIDLYVSKGNILVLEDENEYPNSIANLSKGEITAISEVLKTKELLVIDDKKAKNRTRDLGLEILGTDSLLLDALLYNFINMEIFEIKLQLLADILLLKASKVTSLLKLARLLKK